MEKRPWAKSVKRVSNKLRKEGNKPESKNGCLNKFWTNLCSNVQFVYS